MGKFTPLDFNKYAALARQAAAEGCVLLKNENEALPLRKGDKVAVFGRIAFHYYKSGLGSGGLVNTKYVVGILDALKEEKDITLDENLLGTYEKWIEKNPYDEGQGWGKVPWSQKEMELTDEIVESAKGADAAIVVVGRTAGEDQDNKNEAGSYLLTDTEKEMVEKVSKHLQDNRCAERRKHYRHEMGERVQSGSCSLCMAGWSGRRKRCCRCTDGKSQSVR